VLDYSTTRSAGRLVGHAGHHADALWGAEDLSVAELPVLGSGKVNLAVVKELALTLTRR